MTRLLLDRVACTRGGRLLFEGVEVSLDAGAAAVVTGPNGVGKSSLIRIAAGLLHPAAGTVTRDGAVALLGEAHALDPELPLARALAFWIGDRAGAAMAAVGLADLAAVPVRILSTGQRRRAGLARIVGADAPIWLLDEPANGLDSDGVAQVEALIAAHRAAGGIAVVATHQPIALPGAIAVALG
ncbi:heme ABC exporter ATP-binding protein CcmA [Sphingomonas sp. M6A6_1c]